ncbi:MAG TPA: alanine racemase, partial [Clostridiales bacterium]|nr:alanine racemase [Clostridiales bacterium]
MGNLLRKTYAKIDTGAIENNVRAIRAHIGERSEVMAVVKADAYGHGAVKVARAALS